MIIDYKLTEDRNENSKTFWSDIAPSATISATAGDVSLPSLIISTLPNDAEITYAIGVVKIRAIQNTDASNANSIDGAQSVQVQRVGGSWTYAISIPSGQWSIDPDTKEFGDALIGDNDISGEVTGNGAYYFKFANAKALYNNLVLHDVLVGIKVWYK